MNQTNIHDLPAQLKEYDFTVQKNFSARGESDAFLVQCYRCSGKQDYFLDRTLFVGTHEKCFSLMDSLFCGSIQPDDFMEIKVASCCPYYKENCEGRLEELVAMVSKEDKVYLGYRSRYDHCGHYDNSDHSLLFVSANYDALDVISDGEVLFSQARLAKTGCFTRGEVERILLMGLYIKL